ncbi:MAG: hypothetical protein ACFFD4_34260 [Candidatus Odinarchaeota archaeon]
MIPLLGSVASLYTSRKANQSHANHGNTLSIRLPSEKGVVNNGGKSRDTAPVFLTECLLERFYRVILLDCPFLSSTSLHRDVRNSSTCKNWSRSVFRTF